MHSYVYAYSYTCTRLLTCKCVGTLMNPRTSLPFCACVAIYIVCREWRTVTDRSHLPHLPHLPQVGRRTYWAPPSGRNLYIYIYKYIYIYRFVYLFMDTHMFTSLRLALSQLRCHRAWRQIRHSLSSLAWSKAALTSSKSWHRHPSSIKPGDAWKEAVEVLFRLSLMTSF